MGIAQQFTAGNMGKRENLRSPVGTAEVVIWAHSRSSLRDLEHNHAIPFPSDESLGYCQMPLPGQDRADRSGLVCNNEGCVLGCHSVPSGLMKWKRTRLRRFAAQEGLSGLPTPTESAPTVRGLSCAAPSARPSGRYSAMGSRRAFLASRSAGSSCQLDRPETADDVIRNCGDLRQRCQPGLLCSPRHSTMWRTGCQCSPLTCPASLLQRFLRTRRQQEILLAQPSHESGYVGPRIRRFF
jgi:hypothetical protein